MVKQIYTLACRAYSQSGTAYMYIKRDTTPKHDKCMLLKNQGSSYGFNNALETLTPTGN